MKRRIAIILVFLMVFSLVLNACSGNQTPDSSNSPGPTSSASQSPGQPSSSGNQGSPGGEKEDDIYRVLNAGVFGYTWAGNLDPCQYDILEYCYPVYYLVYDSIFYCDPNDNQMKTHILESWEWSADFLTLKMKLRDDVYFSNGEQMTGEDVLYSVWRKSTGAIPSFYNHFDHDNSYVEADGMTVVIKYMYTFGPAMSKLDIFVVNKSFVEPISDTIDWYDPANAIGSGPYKITEYTKDYSITLELRDDYWGPSKCQANKIVGFQYTDQTTMAIDLERGTLDVILNASEIDTGAALSGSISNVDAVVVSANTNLMLTLSDKSEILQDVAIREAICYAVNPAAIADASYGSLGVVATSPFASGLKWYEPGHQYGYNPDKAKQVLAAAGYSPGEIKLKFLVASNPELYAVAETLQSFLSNIGIVLEIESGAFATVNGRYRDDPQATDFIINRFMDGIPDGDPYFSMYVFGRAYIFPQSRLENDLKMQEYLDVITQSLVDSERAIASKNIQRHLIETFRTIPIVEWGLSVIYRTDKVTNPNMNSLMRSNLRFIQMV